MLLLHWRHLLRILSAWFLILLLRRGRLWWILILLPTFLIGPLWWLYALAVSCGLPRARQLVVVGDGAVWIWHLAAEHFPEAVQIVDIWHAREHVWKVARAVFGPSTPEMVTWAEHACSLLIQGKIEELVEEIVVLPPIPPEPGASRSVPDIERDYFIRNAARMRYPAFRAQGMQVGSGIAEAACKTVVSTRAKRTGMRLPA